MSKLQRLDNLKPGLAGRVASISPCGSLRFKLMEMGLTNGTAIEVIRLAPSGDPVEISLKGYSLALRKNEALNVMVEVDE